MHAGRGFFSLSLKPNLRMFIRLAPAKTKICFLVLDFADAISIFCLLLYLKLEDLKSEND